MRDTIPIYRRRSTLVVALLATLWIAAQLVQVFEPDPIEYWNQPFPVDDPVSAGQPIPIHIVRCNTTGEIGDFTYSRVIRSMEGGMNYQLADGSAVNLDGCPTTSMALNIIAPPQVAPGRYEVIGVVHVQGRLRDHKIVYRSEIFTVEPW